MKVLHLAAGKLFGGIEMNLLTLAQFRHECPALEADYGFCFDGKPADVLRKTGVRVQVFGQVRYSRPWTISIVRRRLRQLLRETTYDAVICHDTWVHGLFAPLVRRLGRPLIYWGHNQRFPDRNWLHWLVRRTPPDRVIANSEYTASSMPVFFPSVPCQVVYCPVAPLPKSESFDRLAIRRRFDTPAESVVVVQVGRWEPHKGHLAHLEALGRLKALPNWVCWQVGAPQQPVERAYQDEVRVAAARLGIDDRVRFLGWQSDLGDVLGAADIYCQPNIRPEPFGISFVEALYAELPVVASNQAGPQEIVTEACGVLCPPGDSEAVATALRRLIADPVRRRALGKTGPARATELCDPARQLAALARVVFGGAHEPA